MSDKLLEDIRTVLERIPEDLRGDNANDIYRLLERSLSALTQTDGDVEYLDIPDSLRNPENLAEEKRISPDRDCVMVPEGYVQIPIYTIRELIKSCQVYISEPNCPDNFKEIINELELRIRHLAPEAEEHKAIDPYDVTMEKIAELALETAKKCN